ncbi:MAG: transglutaminase N-terminal domain-containing protein [Acidimicrobiales bacterium]
MTAGATRYRVSHRTRYTYSAPVSHGQTIAHLVPRTTATQVVVAAALSSDPAPDHRSEYADCFGNQVTYLAFEEPHHAVELTATSEVLVEPFAWPTASPPWEEVVAALDTDRTTAGIEARLCRTPSAMVAWPPEAQDLARGAFRPGRPLHDAVAELTARIHREFGFDPAATDVSTPVGDVLARRRGVCQDFAHLAIACCRSLGLAARYVSGYLETLPAPGQPKLVGADASHAWFAVYLPGWGWFDADPTNDQAPPRRHVTVAWGRDYADVAPARGVVFGPATMQELDVAVDVASS